MPTSTKGTMKSVITIQPLQYAVIGIVWDIMTHPGGRRENKREVKTVIRCTAEPAVSCCIKKKTARLSTVHLFFLNQSQDVEDIRFLTSRLGNYHHGCDNVLVKFSFWLLIWPAMRRPSGLDATHQGLTVPSWESAELCTECTVVQCWLSQELISLISRSICASAVC